MPAATSSPGMEPQPAARRLGLFVGWGSRTADPMWLLTDTTRSDLIGHSDEDAPYRSANTIFLI